MSNYFTPAEKQGLADCIEGDLAGEAMSLEYIAKDIGNVSFCKLCCQGLAEHQALWSYFVDHDPKAFRQWMYVAGKIWAEQFQGHTYGSYTWMWCALLSDHPGLVAHIAQYPEQFAPHYTEAMACMVAYRKKRGHDIHQFWLRQLALRGEWDTLRTEAQALLDNPPKSLQKIVLLDMAFFIALANHDVAGMLAPLHSMIKPGKRKVRNNWAFVDTLFSVDALVLLKIARHHGHVLQIESDYLPPEWLPIQPNATYDDHYDFVRDINLGV